MNLNTIIAFLLSFSVSSFATYKIIKFSHKHNWGDIPVEKRKIHKNIIPNLGGIAVFIATMTAYFAFIDYSDTIRPDKLFSISVFLFFIGIKDDMDPISARNRLLIEFICAFFIIYITDIRFTTLWGLFGITNLNIMTSYIMTSIFIVGCTNAYNLIDGLDGLLASLAILNAACFALIFKSSGEWLWTLLCTSMIGALIGFLIFNWYPAKIFMGNGGALFLGTLLACFALRTMQLNFFNIKEFDISNPLVISYGIISIPVIDMVVVFMLRIKEKKPPFSPDNKHIHHVLLKIGLTHSQITFILLFINIIIIIFAYLIQDIGVLRSLVLTILFSLFGEIVIRLIVDKIIKSKKVQHIH